MRLVKRVKSKVNWQIRILTANARKLPGCLILGAQKAGTSSLFHFLTQHPQVHAPLNKEVHFFSGGINPTTDNYAKGENWYRAHFPLKNHFGSQDLTLEATPLYLFHPLAPQRIKNLLPKCKLIILLRDPVERAISHYFHVKRHGLESLAIEQALQSESGRLQHIMDTGNFSDPAFRLYSYQARGLYLEQIKRYQALFSAEQMLILSSEELMSDSNSVLKKVFNFLEIDNEHKITDLDFKNQGSNKQRISELAYTQLTEYFTEPNKQLSNHLARTFDWR